MDDTIYCMESTPLCPERITLDDLKWIVHDFGRGQVTKAALRWYKYEQARPLAAKWLSGQLYGADVKPEQVVFNDWPRSIGLKFGRTGRR